MAPTIPAAQSAAGVLRDVFASCLESVQSRPNAIGLPPLTHAAVVLVDGLGADALAARSGHARFLASRLTKRTRVISGFPTTTAAALASLTTGADPGVHGIVGYAALNPDSGIVVNQLHGFDDETLTLDWLRSSTVFERAAIAGVRAVAIGPAHYERSGFTRAVLRGAEYLSARTIADRFAVLLDVFRSPQPAIAYLYVPELDQTAHAVGWESAQWTRHLEALDAAVADAGAELDPRDGMLITADHGIIDVPPDRHLYYGEIPGLLDGVGVVAGEPRCLQLHLTPGQDAALVAGRWADAYGTAATVVTRDQAVEAGWFGRVDSGVLPRIGDVLVAAGGRWAFFDSHDDKGNAMIGHHGSFSAAERVVPLIRLGGAAR